MKEALRRKYGGWLAALIVALVICVAVILYERSTMTWRFPEISRMFSDGCFVSGMFMVGFGALVWVSNFGGFSALGYGWYLLTHILSPSRTRFEERMSYLEYRQAKNKKEKSPKCILIIGVIFLALSVLWLGIYQM